MELKTTKDLDLDRYWKHIYEPNGLTDSEIVLKAEKLVNLRGKKLCISMFIPSKKVGDKWEVLENDLTCLKQDFCFCGEEATKDCRKYKKEYQEAEARVLFYGWQVFTGISRYVGIMHEFSHDEIIIVMWDFAENIFIPCGMLEFPTNTIKDLIDLNIPLTENIYKQLK